MNGRDSFDNYYGNMYGGRWKRLRESLLFPAQTVPYSNGLAAPYYLDSSSVLAALSLRLPIEENYPADCPPLILDACAAPGGKTLVLASKMGKSTTLLANEFSSERRRRLSAVLDKHLFPETRSRVRVSGFDAAAAAGRATERDRFAAVLLDVPCSSERHVIQNKSAIEKWTPARPKFLVRRQWALLSAAFLLLQSGGALVYATCSINPEENDCLAAMLVKKYGGRCTVDPPGFSEGEAVEYGRIILPDENGGSGPLYVARFSKG
jgi:16S rRNA (cytosine1407-C5)-methyltransferase